MYPLSVINKAQDNPFPSILQQYSLSITLDYVETDK